MDAGTRPGHQLGLYFDGKMTVDLWLWDLQWILKICTKESERYLNKLQNHTNNIFYFCTFYCLLRGKFMGHLSM